MARTLTVGELIAELQQFPDHRHTEVVEIVQSTHRIHLVGPDDTRSL